MSGNFTCQHVPPIRHAKLLVKVSYLKAMGWPVTKVSLQQTHRTRRSHMGKSIIIESHHGLTSTSLLSWPASTWSQLTPIWSQFACGEATLSLESNNSMPSRLCLKRAGHHGRDT